MRTLVLAGANIFDANNSRFHRGDIAITGGTISAVGTGLEGDEHVDLSGRTVLPGLIDAHTHVAISIEPAAETLSQPFTYRLFKSIRNMSATLDCGITTVRDAAGADEGLRMAVADGIIEGPQLVTSINMISQTGGHADCWMASGFTSPTLPVPYPGMPSGVADGPTEVRKKVREMIRSGAQVIKVATSGGVASDRDNPRHAHFRKAELEALVEEANAAEISVMAHAQGADGIKNAVRAGIRSIEHGIYLDDEAIELMLGNNTWLVPTLIAPMCVLELADKGVVSKRVAEKAAEVVDSHRESFRRAVDAGVRIAMGSDSGVGAHGRNLEELALMHRYGMSNESALNAATISAAELLGLDSEIGSLERGKRADLVVLNSPTPDLENLKSQIGAVIQNGNTIRGSL
ncbi:amidohydrolase family protein [Rhodococcus erythropolis]|uniref:metal-dependent hydrolase family protein n=1 Tax=Rhodococcus erythropolis TaxID=1833 RepID=UPI001E4D07C4|nr:MULTISPECIES: amidohydrolase family protein [Rhodococcus erythropolis group]MCD2109250.1 amidohydrolase family protein [Rhodococcus qingshengii]MCZ4528174.1 amidohydrolase family protein [Rhodococcus erythropolis]